MSKVRDMQEISERFDMLQSEEERRHPAWCRFAQGKGKARTCKCPQSPMYFKQCYSAVKCNCYEKAE